MQSFKKTNFKVYMEMKHPPQDYRELTKQCKEERLQIFSKDVEGYSVRMQKIFLAFYHNTQN